MILLNAHTCNDCLRKRPKGRGAVQCKGCGKSIFASLARVNCIDCSTAKGECIRCGADIQAQLVERRLGGL